MKWNRITRNPADMVKPPKVERTKPLVLTADEAARLLEAIKHSRVYWPTMLALATGMRRGEICALRWRSVDFDRGTVHVIESLEQTREGIRFKPPKSGRTRAVTLPAFAAAELRRLKVAQAQSSCRWVCGRLPRRWSPAVPMGSPTGLSALPMSSPGSFAG